ncbi:MAG: hypothetical protein Q8R59_12080, partial [Polaromonas sp.]|nr:hypothetical protein [Polaromonas sp.]
MPAVLALSGAEEAAVLAGGAARRTALDDPAEWTGFSRPVAGRDGWWESYLSNSGMYCAACSLNVEQ